MTQLPGGILDPELQKYVQQQRIGNWITSLAQGLIKAGAEGRGIGAGLAMGLAGANAGNAGPLDALKMQSQLAQLSEAKAERERRRKRDEAIAASIGPGMSPERVLLAEAAPEMYLKSLAEQEFADPSYMAPETVIGPDGQPMLVRFPKGGGAPQPVEGFDPYIKPTETKPTERERKIQELVSRGMSQTQAEDIASGRIRTVVHPVTGAISLVNVATGERQELAGQPDIPKATQEEMASRVKSIDTLLNKMPSLQSAVEKGVGAVPAAKEFGGKLLGQLPTGSVDIPGIGEIGTGERAVDPEVVQARMSLRIFREEMIEAFRKSGRVPVQEQQRLLEFADKLGVVNSVPDAKLAFQQLEAELRRVRDTYELELGGQSGVGDIETMSLEQLNSLDPGDLSEEDLLRASERFRELQQ